jgi:hypothetical protein
VDAAKKILEQTGGLLIEVENEGERLINFKKKNKLFQFDPNRVFTPKGLRQNLHRLNRHVTPTALRSVRAFSKFILQKVPKSTAILIALHNNDDGEYSIDSYKINGSHVKDALNIHVNPSDDPAYPNPYTDKVNFVIDSKVSGTGSLQVYNMLG